MKPIMDPRAIRTKQSLIDAFHQLIQTKNFEQITIKNITDLAGVNRATFYAHYVDKYTMLDAILGDEIKNIMQNRFSCHKEIDEHTIAEMFLSVIDIHERFTLNCRPSYDSLQRTIEQTVKQMFTTIFEHLMTPNAYIASTATMLSWALYGAYEEWATHPDRLPEDAATHIASKLISLVTC